MGRPRGLGAAQLGRLARPGLGCVWELRRVGSLDLLGGPFSAHPLPTRNAYEVPSVLGALRKKPRTLERRSRLPEPSQGAPGPLPTQGSASLPSPHPGSCLMSCQRSPQTLSLSALGVLHPFLPAVPLFASADPAVFPLRVFLPRLEAAGRRGSYP